MKLHQKWHSITSWGCRLQCTNSASSFSFLRHSQIPQLLSFFFFLTSGHFYLFSSIFFFCSTIPIPYSCPPPCFSPLLFSLVSLPEENCVSLICFIGISNSSASLYTQLFFVIQIPQRLLKNNFWYICFGYLLIFPFLHNCDLNFNWIHISKDSGIFLVSYHFVL